MIANRFVTFALALMYHLLNKKKLKFVLMPSFHHIKRKNNCGVTKADHAEKISSFFNKITHRNAIYRQTLLGIFFQVLHLFDVIVNNVVLFGRALLQMDPRQNKRSIKMRKSKREVFVV